MNSLLKMTLMSSVIVFTLAGCDESKADETKTTPVTTQQSGSEPTGTDQSTENTDKPIDIKIDKAVESYALGVSYAKYLQYIAKENNFTIENKDAAQGFNDLLNDKPKYTEKELDFILTSFDKKLKKEQKERYEAEKAATIAAGDKFRQEFATQPNVKKTESGLLYQIITEGTGEHPKATDTVKANYTATLVDGTKFESTYDQNEPATFPLNYVIPGWAEGLQLIGVGGKIKLVIPPELGYKDERMGPIPGSSTLVFEIELLSIEEPQPEPEPLQE